MAFLAYRDNYDADPLIINIAAIGTAIFSVFGGATATAIEGGLAYLGSWRIVYLVYGISEFFLATIMLKVLKRDQPVIEQLNFIKAYKEPLTNFRFMRLVITIFFVGFSVFGTFTYSAILLQEITVYKYQQLRKNCRNYLVRLCL